MATTQRDEAETGTGDETMAAMVLRATGQFEGAALRYKDGEEWADVSYAELGARVRSLAKGLIALGLEKGDAGGRGPLRAEAPRPPARRSRSSSRAARPSRAARRAAPPHRSARG